MDFPVRVEPDLPSLDVAVALAAGDIEVLQRLYRRHHREVRAFACRLLDDRAAAEDIVQETFIALPKAARRYRGDSTLGSFILGVAANLARHRIRSRIRRRAVLNLVSRAPRESGPDPEKLVVQDRLATALSRALERLPVDQRVAFVLCEVEERTSRDAAEILGVSDSTLRARVRKARSTLHKLLDKEPDHG